MPQFPRPFTNPLDDARRKIDPADHPRIREHYQELKSYQKVADFWHVSKRTIIFICNPDKYAEFQRKRYLLAPWRESYAKLAPGEHAQQMRVHRAKKRELNLLNKVKEPCVVCATPLDQNARRQRFCSQACNIYFHNHAKYFDPSNT